jgi:hypothetical protein
MRNRLNVMWAGKRTTARFPEYLWDMAARALELPDDALADHVACILARREIQFGSASEAVRRILVNSVMQKLPPSCSKASLRQG